ncbi:uncharacterized protein LOC126746250 [Anthonomus grandis grandis]|uniref:uncharacterized protein LOC126746250 n=1 Tax=Anthonomus grandis grandis TaxID=2921223 RepID=UPI002165B778|nr:uncharacterized protein LOC126746250 [Anthonomus grandis grandis]
MVSKGLLPSRIERDVVIRTLSWKLGVYNRRISGRVSKNQCRNFSKQSKAPPPVLVECKLPDPNDCKPPEDVSLGRKNKQPETIPCYPECRKGTAHLPVRGCLPWERGVELCPGKQPARKLESETCEHLCEPYAGQGFINRFRASKCELRRFQKCLAKTGDPAKCMDLAPVLGLSRKVYPMMHAMQKKGIPGGAVTLSHFPHMSKPKSDEDDC